jgi:hypothetical protein
MKKHSILARRSQKINKVVKRQGKLKKNLDKFIILFIKIDRQILHLRMIDYY